MQVPRSSAIVVGYQQFQGRGREQCERLGVADGSAGLLDDGGDSSDFLFMKDAPGDEAVHASPLKLITAIDHDDRARFLWMRQLFSDTSCTVE